MFILVSSFKISKGIFSGEIILEAPNIYYLKLLRDIKYSLANDFSINYTILNKVRTPFE